MKRYLPLLLILPLLAGLLCSCSADAEKEDRLPEVLATQSSAVLKEESANDAVLYYSDTITADTANAPSAASSRKLIKTVTMTVETEAFDAALSSLNDRIDADGGYVESLDISNQHSSGQRSASYTIRIPADQISAFTEHLSANTNVLSRNEQQQIAKIVDEPIM